MTKKIISDGLTLASQVEYQLHAIVSKSILKNPAGSMTIFAFDQDENLSEHTAPYDAVIQVLDGVAEITISGKKHTVKTNEFILLPANKPHAVLAVEKFKMVLTMIKS